MEISPPQRASPPFTPFHPFVNRVGVKECACIKSSMLGNEKYNHTVGAAIKCKNGNIYSGVNCDGIHGACAEYIAMGIAISAGEREFDTIVAVHKDFPNQVIAPCGNCRQMLIEYCPDIKVILNDYENNMVKVGIKDLIPFACL